MSEKGMVVINADEIFMIDPALPELFDGLVSCDHEEFFSRLAPVLLCVVMNRTRPKEEVTPESVVAGVFPELDYTDLKACKLARGFIEIASRFEQYFPDHTTQLVYSSYQDMPGYKALYYVYSGE